MYRRIWLCTLFLAWLATVSAAGVHAATWTFTPELRRLGADTDNDTALPDGEVKVEREGLRVGLYMNVSTDGVNPINDSALGFDQVSGAIHFSSDALGLGAIGPIVLQLRDGAGWERRMSDATTMSLATTFRESADLRLGPPGVSSNEANWIFFWTDVTNPDDDPRGAWCTPESGGSCEIFLGVLAVPLAGLPEDASGALTLGVGGLDSAQEIQVNAMFGRATANPRPGNSVTYTICPASGCPVELTPVVASFGEATYAAGEGESVEVTVMLDAAPGREVTIPIMPGMGVSADLYDLSAESLTFGPDETSRSFTVTAIENNADGDADHEAVELVLSFGTLPASVTSTVAQSNAIVTITDNDDPSVTVAFGRAEYAAMEGGDSVMVTVTLSAAPEREVTVPITVQPQGGASPGDHSVVPASVTFGPDETVKSFAVTAVEEDDRDRNESLTLAFGALPEGVSEGNPASATVMLLDNDTGVALIVMLGTPSATSVDEGGSVEIPVTVHPAPEQAQLTVTYGLTTGTAAAADYNDETGGSVTIAPGDTAGMIRVTIADDNLSEPAETFRVMLTDVVSNDEENEPAELGPEASLSADVTISANDPLMASLSGPARVSEGQTATYTLTLEGGVGTTDVTATLAVGMASTANRDDYESVPSTVTVTAGESERTFEVAIVDDGRGEGEQLLVLEIVRVEGGGGGISVNPAARSVRTTLIEVDLDGRARAMKFALAGFGRLLGDDVVDMIGERAEARDAASGGSYVRLGGRPLTPAGGASGESAGAMGWVGGAVKWLGVDFDDSASLARDVQRVATSEGYRVIELPSERDLMSKSAFRLVLNQGARGTSGKGGGLWTLWGRGDLGRFDGRFDGDFSMEGDVFATHLGVDYRLARGLLMGVALSRRRGTVDYAIRGAGRNDSKIELDLNSVHPYLHWSPNQRLSLWGTLGVGRGGAGLTDDSGDVDTDLKMMMTAAGTRGELLSLGGVNLALKADAFQVRLDADGREELPEAQAESSRFRLVLEGRSAMMLDGGARMTGGAEVGVRVDAGDASTGVGTELGANVGYAHPGGLNIVARGRFLLTNGENEFDQWGASVEVTLDPGASGRGLQFSLVPTYGKASSGMDDLWHGDKGPDALLGSDTDNDLALAARVGYGIDLPGPRGVLTPFGEMSLRGGDSRRLRLGAEIGRWRLGRSALALEFYGEQNDGGGDRVVDRRVVMNARWSF